MDSQIVDFFHNFDGKETNNFELKIWENGRNWFGDPWKAHQGDLSGLLVPLSYNTLPNFKNAASIQF